MAEAKRSVVAVEDDDKDSNLPEITKVYTLSKREVTEEISDPFAVDANQVKELGGTSSNFKRKVTNELKKYNKSADGKTQSKQIDIAENITGYDAFGVVQPPYSMDALCVTYQEMSSAHYAAVNAKVDNIVGLGYKLVESRKTRRGLEALGNNKERTKAVRAELNKHREDVLEIIEGFNDEDSFQEILVKVWTDYEVTGNGYIEIGRKRDGTIGYVGHIPAKTIRVRKDRDGYVQISANKVQFFRNFGDVSKSNPISSNNDTNEIIAIQRYSPVSGYYGIPDIVAAQHAVAGNEFAARYNLEYFENKAVPRHLITLKGATIGSNAQQELLSFFETGLKGQNHRSLFIPLPGDDGVNKVEFKIEAVDAKVQESSFDKYDKSNQAKVLMVHRVPLSKVNTAESASLAIARDADKTFKEQVCGPKQKVMNKKIDRIVKEITDAFEFELNEMTLTDENTKSQVHERYRKTGVMTGNEVRVELGMSTIEGGDELVDLNIKSKEANSTMTEERANRQRDADRSANQTDNAGEGRSPKGDGRTQA